MERYNTKLPQDELGFLNENELDDMFEEKESCYGYGNRLSMRKHISSTKERISQEWDRYRNRYVWKLINRKLKSYVGWNLDRARSDFYKWSKENRIPPYIDLAYEFDYEFGLHPSRSYHHNRYESTYTIDDNKVIRRGPMSDYELRRYHRKYFRNVGHQLLGYRLNPDLTMHEEMTDVLISTFGNKIISAIGGGLIDSDLFNKLSEVNTSKISYKFDELYRAHRVWDPIEGRYTDAIGKYWKPEYGRYGKSMGEIFEAVYSPDIWERKSKSELDTEWRTHMTNKAHRKDRPKARKKANRAHYDQVYEEGILKAKGIAARSAAENLVAIERHGFTKDSFKTFGGQPNLK